MRPAFATHTVAPLLVFMIFSATFFVAYTVNVPVYMQNTTLIAALRQARNQKHVSDTQRLFLRAIEYNRVGIQEAREQYVQAVMRLASNHHIPLKEKETLVNSALAQIQAQMNAYPQDARFPYFTGLLLRAYGKHDLAEQFFTKALDLSPKKVSILLLLGNTASAHNDTTHALQYYRKAQALVPHNEKIQQTIRTIEQKQK